MIKQYCKIALIALALTACKASDDIGSLSTIHGEIAETIPAVSHIRAAELETRLSSQSPDLLILDTRPLAEYKVSHIKGALQVSPDISPQDFMVRFGNLTADKTVIVYCSVGWRSSLAADRLTEVILASGAREISNLEGGLFGWHNDGRPVVSAHGPTSLIHPYDEKWGRLVSRQDALAYTPK